MIRKLLSAYRSIQYTVCRRYSLGVIQQGRHVSIEPFRLKENHGDVVHPCVRYIEEGFEGHKWWLVYTPYYGANATIENPILCFADSNEDIPPTEWKVYCLVKEKPKDGYNSDPTLFYSKGQLYVYWRENVVSNFDNYTYRRATFVARVKGGQVEKCTNIPILQSDDEEIDPETCPTFMQNGDGSVTAYAMHLQFHSKSLKKIRQPWRKWLERIILVSDLMGLFSQQKHFGIAIWKGNEPDKPFTFKKTVQFHKCNALYRPWHMDLFDWEGRRYAIVQTNQSNADIALAESDDFENFTFFRKPIITNVSIKKKGIYKPCAGVTPDGTFFLFYTAQDSNNRNLNKLYLTQIAFDELKNLII